MTAAVLAWGIGLIVGGLVIALLGYRFLVDYRGMTTDYLDSLSLSKPLFSRLMKRSLADVDPTRLRPFLGLPMLTFGLLLMALGAYGLSKV